MIIPLQTIRFYTEDSPYHFTTDNEPLRDLEQNDIAIRNAVNALSQSISTQIVAGNWSTLKAIFDLQQDINKPFAYRMKIWGAQNQATLAGQNSSLIECSILGYNLTPGSVVVSGSAIVSNVSVGVGTLTPVFTGSGNNLEVTFTGYSGANGYVVAKIERFGL